MKIIAHRGAPFFAPENTIKSFLLAQNLGCDIFETDVHMSSDGKLFICHDENLKRTYGAAAEIKTTSAAALRNYGVPELKELLAVLPPRATLNVEIKTDVVDYAGIEGAVLKEISARKENIIISSFNFNTLKNVRALDGKIKIGYLTREFDEDRARQINPFSLNMNYKRITPEILRRAKKLGLEVWAYTVNDFETFKKLENAGVYAAFTDNPYVAQPHALAVGGVI
ncbi:MAG: hypothetical protein LBI01_05000 [Elusimicrobium sp.]|jgi:glycerophosphoryl diester phosphodiesterase|nr:hypothetical protein [Elusimicrobium sp.]